MRQSKNNNLISYFYVLLKRAHFFTRVVRLHLTHPFSHATADAPKKIKILRANNKHYVDKVSII